MSWKDEDMPWGLGTDMQLRRPEMEQMMEEQKRNPRELRRRGCATCLALVIAWVAVILVFVVLSIA